MNLNLIQTPAQGSVPKVLDHWRPWPFHKIWEILEEKLSVDICEVWQLAMKQYCTPEHPYIFVCVCARVCVCVCVCVWERERATILSQQYCNVCVLAFRTVMKHGQKPNLFERLLQCVQTIYFGGYLHVWISEHASFASSPHRNTVLCEYIKTQWFHSLFLFLSILFLPSLETHHCFTILSPGQYCLNMLIILFKAFSNELDCPR
jgi:hypothetical protein